MRVLKVTLTYQQHISLAPYTHVDAGLVVEVEPNPEDGIDALRDLDALIAAAWGVIGPAVTAQVQTAVAEYDALQGERRLRLTPGDPPLRNGTGAAHTPADPQPALPKQRELIESVRESLGWTHDELRALATRLNVDIATLTRGEAQAFLTALHQQPRRARPPVPPAPAEPQGPTPEAGAHQGSPPALQRPPQTPEEAEQRFYARYGETIGGTTWPKVCAYLGQSRRPKPAGIDDWIAAAEQVRDHAKAQAAPA